MRQTIALSDDFEKSVRRACEPATAASLCDALIAAEAERKLSLETGTLKPMIVAPGQTMDHLRKNAQLKDTYAKSRIFVVNDEDYFFQTCKFLRQHPAIAAHTVIAYGNHAVPFSVFDQTARQGTVTDHDSAAHQMLQDRRQDMPAGVPQEFVIRGMPCLAAFSFDHEHEMVEPDKLPALCRSDGMRVRIHGDAYHGTLQKMYLITNDQSLIHALIQRNVVEAIVIPQFHIDAKANTLRLRCGKFWNVISSPAMNKRPDAGIIIDERHIG